MATVQPSKKDSTEYQLIGIVKQVPRHNFNEEFKKFVIEVPQSGKVYYCNYRGFCPVEVGDSIYCRCRIINGNNVLVTRPPFVQPVADRDNTIKAFLTLGKMGYRGATSLYDRLDAKHANVADYLSRIAERWVNTGDTTLLDEFTDMKAQAAKVFLSRWYKQRNYRRLYLLGLTKTEIKNCELDTEEIYNRCLTNPTTLYGISLDKCREIVARNNRKLTDEDMMCGTVLRFVHQITQERKWSCVPTRTVEKLFPQVDKILDRLFGEYEMIAEYDSLFIKKYANIERRTSSIIRELVDNNYPLIPDPYFGDKSSPIQLNSEQKDAVKMALNEGLSMITGGPGTGKTTILKNLAQNLEMYGYKYAMCSYTGKAVARIQEVTGRQSYTIHRLLNKIGDLISSVRFKMIIIDEISMVPTSLFYQLLKATERKDRNWPKFVFVGDINQLPPIDWGDLALSVINIEQIPQVKLKTNMRLFKTLPGETDGILANLDMIADICLQESEGKTIGETIDKALEESECFYDDEDDDYDEYYNPTDSLTEEDQMIANSPFCSTSNFFLFPGTIEVVYDIIIDVHRRGLKQNDITIISPFKRDLKELNDKFEQIFHEDDPSIVDFWGNKWHIGSRVVCLKNNYDLPIYNGTEGIVDDFTDKVLKIKVKGYDHIDGKFVATDKIFDIPLFPRKGKPRRDIDPETGEEMEPPEEFNSKEFALGYAVTCHRAQGSEWPFIVFYLPPDKKASSFVNRNLVYTAISRARRAVWCIGNIDALNESIKHGHAYRHSTLTQRIQEDLGTKELKN